MVKTITRDYAKTSKTGITTLKALPHRKGDPPASTSTSWPRAALCRDPGPLMGRRRPRLGVSCRANARARTPTIFLPLIRGRGTATGQRPRHRRLSPVACLRCGRRLRTGDGPTLRRRWRGVSARTAQRRLPLLAIAGPARCSLRGSSPRDGDVGLRRTLKDPIEAGCHPLRIVTAIIALITVVLVRRVLLRLPLCLDFTRRVSSA